MDYKGFRILNQPAYIWRIYCWGAHAGHNHVSCWYVFDMEGKKISGGYTSGNNTRSGAVDLARRKDAKAWIDGYCAYRDEPENRQVCPSGLIVYAPTYGQNCSDTQMRESFDAGYFKAQSRLR